MKRKTPYKSDLVKSDTQRKMYYALLFSVRNIIFPYKYYCTIRNDSIPIIMKELCKLKEYVMKYVADDSTVDYAIQCCIETVYKEIEDS